MRTKVTLVLLLLNVLLFFFIFRVERSWQTERVALEVRRQVLGAEAADIRSLEVSSTSPGGSFRVERRGDSWFLTKPVDWPANPQAVNRMISALQFLEHETSFSVDDVLKNNQSLEDYGLAHPKLAVTLTSGGQDTTGGPPVTTRLRIGDATKTGERLYLLSPDGSRIHVVGREMADSLSLPLRQLRADTIFTIPVFEARSLNLQAAPPAGVRVLIQRDGNRWWFETPIPALASKEAIDLAVNGLDALRVKRFVNGASPVPAPKDEPVLTATIEGDRRHETLFLGQKVPGADPSPAGQDTYAQLEGFAVTFVVSVPVALLETLRTSQESLRDHHVLEYFDPGTVTVITLQAPGRPELILQRLEPDVAQPSGPDASAGAASDPGWQIVLRGEAGQGPATLPADRAVVRSLLDDLLSLSAQQFKSDAPQASDMENWGFKLPERIVTLTLQTSAANGPGTAPATVPAASEISLEIGRASQRESYVYARQAKPLSASIYAVSPDILRQTPMAPTEWRDRTLTSLPEAAKIRALKLTEVDNQKVILDWTAEKPGSPAVDAVLEQLRILRARRFVANAFSQTVKIDGEQRPWKFRLDAVIALPTGAGGERTSLRTLWLADRTGGDEQFAGSADFGAVFTLDQPFLDALWTLTHGGRDPGPPPPSTRR